MKPNVPHYQQTAIEPIDYIRAQGRDVFEGFCIGNVIKYVSRYRHKGAPLADLEKARVYLDWLIEEYHDEST